MGSQTLEILRQGVWASLTGGWFYDPHQDVFCNAVHLYLWLFLLCTPFITYLYFPTTFTTWGLYCFTTAFTITVLKIINMALHALYDKAQAMSDPSIKKSLKSLKENEGFLFRREDECGIEMQVLGADLPSRTSVEQVPNETSGANSMISIDCQEPITSTIDLKVDVHRKNSSESSDSVAIYSNGLLQNVHVPLYRPEICQFSKNNSNVRSLKVKSKSEEKPSQNPSISEEILVQDEDDDDEDDHTLSDVSKIDGAASVQKILIRKDGKKFKRRLQRQNSLDTAEALAIELSLARRKTYTACRSAENSNAMSVRNNGEQKCGKLQRHRSSESNDERQIRKDRNVFLGRQDHHQYQSSGRDIRNHLQSLTSDLYLENSYTKSDLGIENIEHEMSKTYLLQQSKPMRKDSNSTMSALQLSVASSGVNNTKKRRHSNAGCKPVNNNLTNVRRIKSAALEISCPQPSVSNLCPHPNSAEAIPGQQIKNPQSAVLPPPSKCLVRNPHLNLCPKVGSFGGSATNSNGVLEPVYPIAEQADEKSLNEAGFTFSREVDSEIEDNQKEHSKIDMSTSQQQGNSTTESESDPERPRTQSTDSETENNGSRSPLLNNTKSKVVIDEIRNKTSNLNNCSSENINNNNNSNNSVLSAQNKNGDSGCPSSDCEQVSASSKDMLLSKDVKNASSSKFDGIWSDYNPIDACARFNEIITDFSQEENEIKKKYSKEGKSLGAIPKTGMRKESASTDFSLSQQQQSKRNLGAVPKTASRASSSTSSRSFSAESFCNEIFKSTKEQWITIDGAGSTIPAQNVSNLVNSGNIDILYNGYARRTFIDSSSNNYRLQPKLRRTGAITKRNLDRSTSSGGVGGIGNLNDHNHHGHHSRHQSITATTVPAGSSKFNQLSSGAIGSEEISSALEFGSGGDLQNSGNAATHSIQGIIAEPYSFENSLTSEQRAPTGAILNIGHVEFVNSVYCDFFPHCSLSAEKPVQPKRFYKYTLNFFGKRELKIAMDRLQLLALFDRDLNWFHVILAVILSSTVCLLGSTILQLGFYKDIFAFLFCVVIAGSQYSLLKSVQPDAASPIHGFNKTVAYSRPIYFCICSGLLVFSHHLKKELESDNYILGRSSEIYTREIQLFGLPFSPEGFLSSVTKILSIILLLFPIFFSLGLFPQINTFCMYFLEQVDMHVFGGSAACSLSASFLSVTKSILAVAILYGPVYGGLSEPQGTQHILFSMFCALLIPISYHLSRSASDFTHVWALLKSCLVTYSDDDEDDMSKINVDCSNTSKIESDKNITSNSENKNLTETEIDGNVETNNSKSKDEKTENLSSNNEVVEQLSTIDSDPPDPLPKKLQNTVNQRLKNDLVVSCVLTVITLALHCSTIFSVLQPDLNTVLYIMAAILGFLLHYVLPQMRKHLPWLCFANPIFKQKEFGRFEVAEAAKVMWFEKVYVYLCFIERNVLYPLIFISSLTADSMPIARKFGIPFGAVIIAICGLKCVRGAYADTGNQYLILIFSVLFFKMDYNFASETFLVDYFLISLTFKKACDFLLKVQFIVTYIAPWQITWGSAFHAFAQPFSVPHSAMLFLQAAISAILSTPLNPFLGSAIFLTSYVRPIKFWERDYNTRRIDHSNTRLSSQLERDLGADDNNLNSIFYEHLTRSLQHSLCGDLILGRWGNVNQGDCFVLASDYLNCLVHIIELGNGLCTFQMRGLEFRGTYCQQREVEAISEEVEHNDGCCCCSPGHIPKMLSANAMFSTRWLAWQVIAAQYVLEGYSISENLATATLQVFEFRKVLITYYVKSIIYYVTKNKKLDEWLTSVPIQDALQSTLSKQFVDLDPIFNSNLDEDFDFRALGITRQSFCSVYMGWIQFCYSKRKESTKKSNETNKETGKSSSSNLRRHDTNVDNINDKERSQLTSSNIACGSSATTTSELENSTSNFDNDPEKSKEGNTKNNIPKSEISGNPSSNETSLSSANTISKDSSLVSLCLALGLLARRSLATASHSSLSGVEFFLNGLHALFKGDFRITSPRDEWVFADMELLHNVVAPAVKMALKLHQDHFSCPDEYLDPVVLYEAISSHSQDLVISHEADPVWRSAVLKGAPRLLALRHVMEDGSDEYRIVRLTKRFLCFRVIKLNRECVRGLWAGQQQELIYLRNRNPERGSIQNAKQALRNIINSSCDQPIGYPIYVSPLTTSYAETNEQLCRIIGGSITLDSIRSLAFDFWSRLRQRCREGCSSGSGAIDCDTVNDVPGVYFSPAATGNSNIVGTISYGSQSLSGAGARGSLASMNKPTSSTLLAGFLSRERDQERESVRDRPSKKSIQSRAERERERRATLPITSSTVGSGSSRDLILRDAMGSTNSELRQLTVTNSGYPSTKTSCSAGNLGENHNKNLEEEEGSSSKVHDEFYLENKQTLITTKISRNLIELNKKVIIVDGTEIYDCLDLGRRIDVVWPNEKMRSNGGRSTWKDWSPQEGMVGYVVHYWQPNHSDTRFRSNFNRTLYLIEIGEHYVPVGENGIREYNQIPEINVIKPSVTIDMGTDKNTVTYKSGIKDKITSSASVLFSSNTLQSPDINSETSENEGSTDCNRINDYQQLLNCNENILPSSSLTSSDSSTNKFKICYIDNLDKSAENIGCGKINKKVNDDNEEDDNNRDKVSNNCMLENDDDECKMPKNVKDSLEINASNRNDDDTADDISNNDGDRGDSNKDK